MFDRDSQLRQPSGSLPGFRGTIHPSLSSASGSSTQAVQLGVSGGATAAATASLFSGLVPSSVARESVEFVPAVHSRLQAISLELFEGEQLSSIQALLGPINKKFLTEFLKYAAYLASNNILGEQECDQILQCFVENSNLSALATLFSTKLQLPTVDAFARCLFESALRIRNAEVLQILLKAGVDPNTPNRITGSTPLQAVVSRGDMLLGQTLLDAGADINALSTGGESALHTAIFAQDDEMIQMMLDADADVNVAGRIHCSRTVLQSAAERGDVSLVEFLLDAGADVNAPAASSLRSNNRSAGCTALQQLAAMGELYSESVEQFVGAGADINAPPYWAPEEWYEDSGIYGPDSHGITALQGAVYSGVIELVQLLLDACADVNAPPAAGPLGGMTALQIAARCGIELVQLLLSVGANVNAPSASNRLTGRTALQAAAEFGNIEVVQMLLEAGANINASGYPVLSLALASKSSLLLVPILLDAGADVNATENSPLKSAIESAHGGHFVPILLEAGAEVNGPGCSPLVWAIQSKQHEQLVPILLGAGADVNGDATHRKSPLTAAVEIGDVYLVERLLALGAEVNVTYGETALEAAISGKRLEMIQVLLSAGADPNGASEYAGPGTLLSVPVMKGDIKLVEALLSFGVNANNYHHQDGLDPAWVSNALPIAAQSGNKDMVQLLLDAGAAVDASYLNIDTDASSEDIDVLGTTALLSAVRHGRNELAALLLQVGANVNTRPQPFGGWTALQAAAKCGNTELVRTLLDKGAHVDDPAHTELGRTALQAASFEGHIDLVLLFLEAGADPNAPPAESRGITALQGAAIQGHLRIALLLIEAGADPNAPPAKFHGRTALEGAAEHGRLDMLQLLLNANADIGGGQPERAREFALQNGHTVVAKVLDQLLSGVMC